MLVLHGNVIIMKLYLITISELANLDRPHAGPVPCRPQESRLKHGDVGTPAFAALLRSSCVEVLVWCCMSNSAVANGVAPDLLVRLLRT